jgi:hypothetical protein
MRYIKWRELTKEQRKQARNMSLPVAMDDDGDLVVAFPDDDQPIGTVESVRIDPETGEQVATLKLNPPNAFPLLIGALGKSPGFRYLGTVELPPELRPDDDEEK